MIPVAEALDRLFALVRPTGTEEVPLTEAAGRVLLRPVAAKRDQPPFDASAMDGFAVRAVDAVAGARLRVVGESQAGRRFAATLGPGEAVRILTGAPMPPGADAVVIQEEAARDGDAIVVSATATPGHVRLRGGDFSAGAELVGPRRLLPADLALVAAFGHAAVGVARRPEVVIISTGDELAWPGGSAGSDQVFAANAFGLHALLEAAGARARLLPPVPDEPWALAAAFDLASGADLVLTIGGASVGDRDLVAPAAEAAGASLSFHKVAMRPGKPLLAGRLPTGAMLVGLPGNPVSAVVCGAVFVRPVILAMQGLPPAESPRLRARLAAPLPSGGPREHYLRGRREDDGRVRAFDRQDSSLLSVLADADCLVVQPPLSPALAAGDAVEIVPL